MKPVAQKKTHLDSFIGAALARGDADDVIVRRLFCFNASPIIAEHSDAGFDILNAVAKHFQVPFMAVHIVGAAQTGYSYFKERDFILGESDLDLAIVDPLLFRSYSELAFFATSGYSDLTKFPVKDGISQADRFKNYLVKGFFRPDLMPYCEEKQEWFSFFNKLSTNYTKVFSDINCGIYFSEPFFERKQVPILMKYRKDHK